MGGSFNMPLPKKSIIQEVGLTSWSTADQSITVSTAFRNNAGIMLTITAGDSESITDSDRELASKMAEAIGAAGIKRAHGDNLVMVSGAGAAAGKGLEGGYRDVITLLEEKQLIPRGFADRVQRGLPRAVEIAQDAQDKGKRRSPIPQR